MHRWPEYDAGTLVPPAVVQHDEVNGEHLVWVWTGEKIVGPLSRKVYDEAEVLETATYAPDQDIGLEGEDGAQV